MAHRLVLIFMIDALGFEEAGTFSFLPSLDRPRAPIRSVLGYSSAAIPTIMSGEMPARHGHFSMYRRAGADGVFRGLRPWLRLAARIRRGQWRVRPWIRRYLRGRGLTGYFSLYEIPLDLLGEFDLCQRRNLYTPGAFEDLPGLADHMARAGGHRIWSWRVPEDQAFAELSSEVDRGEKRALLLYTARLDSIMHATGPASAATRECLAEYERRIVEIIRRARTRYGEVRIFIFGDHGMAPIRGVHDLWTRLTKTGHRIPEDLLYFLDSTMARFWFRSESARRDVEALLADLPYGRVLPRSELTELGASFADDAYGELIFLLEEGEMLAPSFMSRGPLRGMHGYHPGARHSYTTLVTDTGDRPYPRDLPELHRLLRDEILGAASRPEIAGARSGEHP